MKYTWETDENVELWRHDEFDSIKECIEDARENYEIKVGDTIAVGIMSQFEPRVDIESMLERMEYQAYEECGEAAESWSVSYREGHQKEWDELFEGVQALVEKYLDKIGETPKFYRVDNIRTIEIEEE